MKPGEFEPVYRVVQWANYRSPNAILYSSPMYIQYKEDPEGNHTHLICSLDVPRGEEDIWRIQSPDDTFLGISPATVEVYVGNSGALYYPYEVISRGDSGFVTLKCKSIFLGEITL